MIPAFNPGGTWRSRGLNWVMPTRTSGSPEGSSDEVTVRLKTESTKAESHAGHALLPLTQSLDINADRLIIAAIYGWGVTLRLSLLRLVDRWPALVLGWATGSSLGFVHSYARAKGWL